MIKVSVIVPVYNVEKYIRHCLDSLLNQSFNDIEIIVINDGSTDNSKNIITEYTNKYSNVIYYDKENGGLSSARNLALNKTNGEYIMFVDSDDWLEEKTIENVYKKAISNDYDLVVFDTKLVYDDKEATIVYSGLKNDILDKKEIKNLYIDFYPIVVNKLYKASLLKDITFKEGVWYEDVEFIYRLLPRINKIGVLHEAYYNYYQRHSSISKTFNEHLYDYISNLNGVIEYYHQNDLYDEYKKELEYFYVRYIYATFIKGATHYDHQEFNKAVKEAIINVKEHFPHYRRNKYFYQSLKGIYLVLFTKLLSKIIYMLVRMKG